MLMFFKNRLLLLKQTKIMRVLFLCLLLFIPLLNISGQTGAAYSTLNESTICGETTHFSIYATPGDVQILRAFLGECSHLKFLRIKGYQSGPHWDELFEVLANCDNLEGLEFFYNDGLVKVPKDLNQNKSIKTISIIGNRKLDYDDFFKKLSKIKSLKKISLIDNKLQKIPKSITQIEQLKQLYITGNENLNYEDLISRLSEIAIEELSIPLNSLSELPENIGDLKQLKVLDIRRNYIEQLPTELKNADSLKSLSADHNLFVNVPSELLKIKELNIKHLSVDVVNQKELDTLMNIFPSAKIIKQKTVEKNELLAFNGQDSGQAFNPQNGFEIKNCTTAIKKYTDIFLKRNFYSQLDSLSFSERLVNANYAYNEKILADGTFDGVTLLSHNKFWVKSNVNYPKYKTKKDEIAFSICPDGNLYPELKAFNGMLWVYVGVKSKKEFYVTYIKNKQWKDVYLEYDALNNTFFVVLKGEKLHKIPAYPRYVNKRSSLKLAQLHYDSKYEAYERRLGLRGDRFDQELAYKASKLKIREQKIQQKKWQQLRRYMCAEEKLLSQNGWLAYKQYYHQMAHKSLDTLSLNDISIKVSASTKGYVTEFMKPTKGLNVINTVSAKLNLQFINSKSEALAAKVFIFYPPLQKLVAFDEAVVEIQNNIAFFVTLIIKNQAVIIDEKVFYNLVKPTFTDKGVIPVTLNADFKTYTLNDFWKTVL